MDNSPNNNVSQGINEINNAEKINEKKFGNNSNKNNGTKILAKYNEYEHMKKTEIIFVIVWCTYRISVLTMSCMCAFLHRRHLMVWAVFAPKVSTELSVCTLHSHLHIKQFLFFFFTFFIFSSTHMI